jgi:hypothetical protein
MSDAAKSDKKTTTTCYSCGSTVDLSSIGIRCQQGHHLCKGKGIFTLSGISNSEDFKEGDLLKQEITSAEGVIQEASKYHVDVKMTNGEFEANSNEEFSLQMKKSTVGEEKQTNWLEIGCCKSMTTDNCTKNFVETCLQSPEQMLPPKCMLCQSFVNLQYFEMQLDQQQCAIFHTVMATKELQDGECVASCPFCQYFEIRQASACDMFLFHCGFSANKVEGLKDVGQRPNTCCSKTSCAVCKKEVDCPEDDGFASDDDDDEPFLRHLECVRLRDVRLQFDSALERGENGTCPHCGLTGRKDDACMHMDCEKCSGGWCYFCGEAEEKVDCDETSVTNGSDRLYAHNVDWEEHSKRCPMYLTQINEVDPSWPEKDDTQCLNLFHKKRAIDELRKFRGAIGEDAFMELWQAPTMGAVRACGHTLEEIEHLDVTMIAGREGEAEAAKQAEEEAAAAAAKQAEEEAAAAAAKQAEEEAAAAAAKQAEEEAAAAAAKQAEEEAAAAAAKQAEEEAAAAAAKQAEEEAAAAAAKQAEEEAAAAAAKQADKQARREAAERKVPTLMAALWGVWWTKTKDPDSIIEAEDPATLVGIVPSGFTPGQPILQLDFEEAEGPLSRIIESTKVGLVGIKESTVNRLTFCY